MNAAPDLPRSSETDAVLDAGWHWLSERGVPGWVKWPVEMGQFRDGTNGLKVSRTEPVWVTWPVGAPLVGS
ncbi:MAG: hypothetical protein ACQESR_28435, partial [Planctomycetota bacterium]